MSASIDDSLRRAQLALSRGELQRAKAFCEGVLARHAGSVDARYLLGLAHALAGEPEPAIEHWRQVLASRPRDFATLTNLGVALSRQGKHVEAVARLRAALAVDDSQSTVHCSLGNSLLALGEVDCAIDSLRAALAREPRFAAAHNSLGTAYQRAGRAAAARVEFEAAVAADPACLEAHCNLGAVSLAAGDPAAAAVSYRLALNLDRHCVEAALELARALERDGRIDEAIAALIDAAAANPKAAEVHYARGIMLHRAGRLDDALECYEAALSLRPDYAAPWRDRARALEGLQRLPESLESYHKAVSLAREDAGSLAGLLSACVRTCEWTLAAQTLQRLRATAPGVEALHPFLSLSVCEDPDEQLRCSRAHAVRDVSAFIGGPRARGSRERLRVAYVSADLRDHAIAHLLIGVLERHDRACFEIHAISLQPQAPPIGIGRRLQNAFEHFHDVSALADAAVAAKLRELAIDVAVDLNGHTVGGRPGIFAHRGAPVQASWLGYAGTTGASFTDYLIADEVVIPEGDERFYSERIVRLPHCYLPNDDKREITPAPTREAAGLPASGAVLCAFTNAYKITPTVFAVWMRLLRQTPGSVLWLRAMGEVAQRNLQNEAERRGVSPERLVFAAHVKGMAEHLGRQALADLYLDTQPYNAHSTACDALWAGVPVLSCTGRTFAARAAASVLRAVGLPELITGTLTEYEGKALELLRAPEKLRELRERLARQRLTSPLFDTERFTRHLESAYLAMSERAASGEPPLGFRVPDSVAPARASRNSDNP